MTWPIKILGVSMTKKELAIFIGVTLIVVAMYGCGQVVKASLNHPNHALKPAGVKQGTPITVRGMTINVTGMDAREEIGDGFMAQKARGIWLILKLHVRNDSAHEQSFSADEQKLIDASIGHGVRMNGDHLEGVTYSAAMLTTVELGPASVSLNPGLEGDVVVAYDVPFTHPRPAFALQIEIGYMGPPGYIYLISDCDTTSCGPSSVSA